MDRLSAYAAREAEAKSPEDKAKAEEEATVRLLEQLKVSKASKSPDVTKDEPDEDAAPKHEENEQAPPKPEQEAAPQTNGDHKTKGIPDNVRLFEIFHEQVMNVISAQRLPIQDITALLVSLANLAL